MSTRQPRKLRLMVSSTVYGIESLLDQVYAILTESGYEVWMSHKGTLPLDPNRNAFDNCLGAVDSCDVFLGIITGRYGSGRVENQPSITHQEIVRAVESRKLRWFLVHYDVMIARQLLQQFRFDEQGNRKPLAFKRTGVLDDIRVLEMYEAAMRQDVPQLADRVGNWVQTYRDPVDVLRFLEAQFADPLRIAGMLPRKRGRRKTL